MVTDSETSNEIALQLCEAVNQNDNCRRHRGTACTLCLRAAARAIELGAKLPLRKPSKAEKACNAAFLEGLARLSWLDLTTAGQAKWESVVRAIEEN